MSKVTNILSEEHNWIRVMLDCLSGLVEEYRSKGTFDSKTATELQSIFEHFVDGQHQDKEEQAIFPKILERVKELQEDHSREREHLERMRYSLFNATLGDPSGCEDFAEEAQVYIDMQRRHMAQERLGLLPLARQLLTAEDEKEALAAFARREAEGPDREDIRQRVSKICETLGVPFDAQEDSEYDEAIPSQAT